MEIKNVYTLENKYIDGLFLITPKIYKDNRGHFQEIWNKKKFNQIIGRKIEFVQDNNARSVNNSIRGLHLQKRPFAQGKLVRCSLGEIYDVAVDLREDSSSYGSWVGVNLSDKNHNQLWIPEGFAHGFLTLSPISEVIYKTNNFYNSDKEICIRWDDETIGIKWPICNENIILSQKDSEAPFLKDLKKGEIF